MSSNFYPPPPVFIGGRQPYQPKLGLAQSGPVPQAPPIRAAAAVLALLVQSWQPAAYALPQRTQIAPLIPAAAQSSSPPALAGTNLSIVIRAWDAPQNQLQFRPGMAPNAPAQSAQPLKPPTANQSIIGAAWLDDPQVVIGLSSAALIEIDDPPRFDRTDLFCVLDAWRPPQYAMPPQTLVASLLAVPVVPSQPPVATDVALSLIVRNWDPPQYSQPPSSMIAPLVTASSAASQPPVFSRTAISVILRGWDPAAYALPKAADIGRLSPPPAAPSRPPLKQLGVMLGIFSGSWSYDQYSITQRSKFAAIAPPQKAIAGALFMPNLVGLELQAAEKALIDAGVLVPRSLGYFGTWPISVKWKASSSLPGVILAQEPAPNSVVFANSAVKLTASEPTMSVSYPGSNWSAF